MKRLTIVMPLAGLAVVACALSTFPPILKSAYNLKSDSAVVKARCAVCHVANGNTKLNPYGADVKAALQKAKSTKLTAAILHSIDKLDSYKIGKTNGAQLKAGVVPGTKGK